ncbi:Protein CBR-AEX-1 [Caenorhabditis briggsae]|uniref:Protein CBR-AEX-1 n=1 Tax=Caenorhabditis briggsae TaxID=6238 RepID=A8XEN6_CAEBR|nr:Protein CBR-AEX-1 [Caenorhabditis briggsae]CAP31004.2 Protein CBR-AEX-1 [Caenorhabditis briggsae]
MREESLESICSALSISFGEDPIHLESIIDRFSEKYFQIFKIRDHLGQLRKKCEKFQTFTLEIRPIGGNGTSATCPENVFAYTRSLQTTRIENHRDHKVVKVTLKFGVLNPKKDGTSNKKGASRSASLLRKLTFSERKSTDEQLKLSIFPLDISVRKNINLGSGKSVLLEMTLKRNDHRNLINPLDFDDFLEMTRSFHEWQAENCELEQYDGNLGDPTFSMFYSIAFFFEIPSFVLKITEMTCFLVWDDEMKKLDEKALTDVTLKMTACESEVDLQHPLLNPSLIYLNDCACNTIRCILQPFSNEPFFPPVSSSRLKTINASLKLITDICILDVWDEFENLANPSNFLSLELKKLLEKSAEKYGETLKKMEFHDLCRQVQSLWLTLSNESHPYCIFFHQFDINYIGAAMLKLDLSLAKSIRRSLINQLEEINHRNPTELENFTKTTMRLFVTLRNLLNLIGTFHLPDCRLFHFEEWFKEITVFWTYSWREVTQKMVERTITLDEDGDSVKYGARRPLPAGLYSFLCIQKGISDDMARLEFALPHHLVICSASVINIMCQNINTYAKKLFNEAMRNHEEKASRLVRATNGIEQAMCFVEEGYRRFAQFQRVEEIVDKDDLAAVRTTSQRLLKSTRDTCETQISTLLSHFVTLKNDIVMRIAKNLCADGKESNGGLRVQQKNAISKNRISEKYRPRNELKVFWSVVMDWLMTSDVFFCPSKDIRTHRHTSHSFFSCFKLSTRHFATSLETEIRKNIRQKQPAEYYSNIYVSFFLIFKFQGFPDIALKYIYEFLEIDDRKDINLLSDLHLNSFSTNDLILSYYDSLCEKIDRTRFGNSPHVDVHISYIKMDDENTISIQIKLVKMSPIEWIDVLSDRVDYFVRLELFPKILFPSNKFDSPTTNPMPQSTRPQWKELFEIQVPLECFFLRGACLAISVFDHERFVDRLVGRGFISLHSVPEASEEKPTQRLQVPLLPNDFSDQNNVFYQVRLKLLKSRSCRDAVAKEFIETRTRRHQRIRALQTYIKRNRHRVGHMLLG